MHPRLVGQSLPCSSSPNPARAEANKDSELSSRLSFVPNPRLLPQALLDGHSLCWSSLISSGMVSQGLESSQLPALKRGIQTWHHPWGCTGCWTKPCDSFPFNYNNLYPG